MGLAWSASRESAEGLGWIRPLESTPDGVGCWPTYTTGAKDCALSAGDSLRPLTLASGSRVSRILLAAVVTTSTTIVRLTGPRRITASAVGPTGPSSVLDSGDGVIGFWSWPLSAVGPLQPDSRLRFGRFSGTASVGRRLVGVYGALEPDVGPQCYCLVAAWLVGYKTAAKFPRGTTPLVLPSVPKPQ